jgi:hypothetical protein
MTFPHQDYPLQPRDRGVMFSGQAILTCHSCDAMEFAVKTKAATQAANRRNATCRVHGSQ